jgi:hypothetical protein
VSRRQRRAKASARRTALNNVHFNAQAAGRERVEAHWQALAKKGQRAAEPYASSRALVLLWFGPCVRALQAGSWGVNWFQRGVCGQSAHYEAAVNWDAQCTASVGPHLHFTARNVQQFSVLVMAPRVPSVRAGRRPGRFVPV